MALDNKMLIQMDGPFFEEVQKAQIFEDQKTFVDSTPNKNPEEILQEYAARKDLPTFDMLSFVLEHFHIPSYIEPIPMSEMSLDEYIQHAWSYLERNDPSPDKYSTRISIPHPYIVPGGRFRELFYWDSFFTALGLVKQHDFYMFMDMIKNYSYLIDTYGFIPNGTRHYFLSRSQPPVFVLYIDLLEKLKGFNAIIPFIQKLDKEYQFWMNGADHIKVGEYLEHCVKVDKDTVLNRYYDKGVTPREESFYHDYVLGSQLEEDKAQKLYKDLRAGAESGWDFSSRWFKNGKDLRTIATTDILPIDLNCLIYLIEAKLSNWFKKLDNKEKCDYYHSLAEKRAGHIQTYFWSEEEGFYFDYYWTDEKRSESWTIAATFPLFVGIATKEQATKIAEHIEKKFLQTGGILTTLNNTKEQWDSPNGWAPLQWIAVKGLENYGFNSLAEQIKKRFTDVAFKSFKETGALFEKYNMLEQNTIGSGGEYKVQIGFGWTNGVLMDFME